MNNNKITPFKGRKINYNKPVKVYRNLNKPGVVWSIVQNGLVVAHSTRLRIIDAKFKVSQAGIRRAARLGHKVVCGWAIGKLSKRDRSQSLPFKVYFNRKKGFNLTSADDVIFNDEGCSAYNENLYS